MKKTFTAAALICLLALSACSGNQDQGAANNTAAPATATAAQTSGVPANTDDLKPDITDNAVVPTSEATDNSSDPTPDATAHAEADGYEIVGSTAQVYTDGIGTVWVQAAIRLKNTGDVPLYLGGPASIDIENAEGELIETIEPCSFYPSILQPGETALMVEPIVLGEEYAAAELTAVPHFEAEPAGMDCIRLSVSEEELKEDKEEPLKMTGCVKNDTDETQQLVYVVANLYDANDRAIGQLYTILTDALEPGETAVFESTCISAPDSLTADNVARYEVFAFPFAYQF